MSLPHAKSIDKLSFYMGEIIAHYTGKIWVLNMGNRVNGKQAQSQNSYSWSQEKRLYDQPYTRGGGAFRRASKTTQPQSERVCRTDSEKPNQLRRGDSGNGGIASQLIELLESQVATRRSEIDQLEQKISELKAIAATLQAADRPNE